MKKTILPIALLMLVASAKVNAQDWTFKDISFEYTQLPSKPLKKEFINYQSKVVLKYMDDINASKGSYQDRVKKAEDDYAKAMDNYYIQQKLADDQYNKETEAWNKKSLAEKILLDKEKPQKRYIPQPYKQMPVEEKYQKTFDTDMLANKYFRLEGFMNSPANAVIVTVKLLGFDNQTPELNTKEYTKTATGQPSTKAYKYSYTIKYKHPVGYRVETPSDGLVWEDFPIELTNYSVAVTPEYDDKYQLDSWWNNAKDGFINNLQEQIVNTNCSKVGTTLNNMFGFRKMTYATELGFVDEKKDYQDLKDAYAAALAGYNALITDLNRTAAMPQMQLAADIWEKAMKESDVENKKARIDRHVTQMLEVNLIQVYMWMNQFEKAQVYFDKLIALDPQVKNRHRAERLIAFSKDLKERWNANK